MSDEELREIMTRLKDRTLDFELYVPVLVAEIMKLQEACRYAAGSFAQVPSDQTVPPIVLHDCKRKLEEALTP